MCSDNSSSQYPAIITSRQRSCRKILKILPTAREPHVFRVVCHSVHNLPHGYSVTAHPYYGAVGRHPTRMLFC